MSKTYEPADNEVQDRIKGLLDEFHPELSAVGIRIDAIFAMNPDGDAIRHQGYKALAVVRKLPLKDRAMSRGDAEIVIDRDAYEVMDDKDRDALLDHELYHLECKRDDKGLVYDDLGRPELKMRKHDVQVGWFREIAVRHGRHSQEVKQAKNNHNDQAYFAFIKDAKVLNLQDLPETRPDGPSHEQGTVTISGGGVSATTTVDKFTKAAKEGSKRGGTK